MKKGRLKIKAVIKCFATIILAGVCLAVAPFKISAEQDDKSQYGIYGRFEFDTDASSVMTSSRLMFFVNPTYIKFDHVPQDVDIPYHYELNNKDIIVNNDDTQLLLKGENSNVIDIASLGELEEGFYYGEVGGGASESQHFIKVYIRHTKSLVDIDGVENNPEEIVKNPSSILVGRNEKIDTYGEVHSYKWTITNSNGRIVMEGTSIAPDMNIVKNLPPDIYTVTNTVYEEITLRWDREEKFVEDTTMGKFEIVMPSEPNVSIVKDVITAKGDDKIAEKGEAVAYTIKVKNNGNEAATNVIVKDEFSEQLLAQLDSDTSSKTVTITRENGDISVTTVQQLMDGYNIGSVDINEEVTLQFETKMVDDDSFIAGATLPNTARVSHDKENENEKNKECVAEITTVGPALHVEKRASEEQLLEHGQEITYSISVSNTGTSSAYNVKVQDTMSEILKYYTDVDKADVTITNKNGELLKTITSSELIAGHTIAELPQGEVYTYNFKLSAKTDFAAGEAVTNKVVVTPENKPPIEASVTLTTTAPITSTIAKPPETGDNNYLLLCEGVMLVSIVGIAYVIISVLKGKRNVRNT